MKFLFLFLISLGVGLSACSFVRKDPVILQIHSQKWTQKEFANALAKKIKSQNISLSQNQSLEQIKKNLIADLMMDQLIIRWAKAHKIEVSQKELEEALQKIKTPYPSASVFQLYLKRKNTDLKSFKKNIKKQLLYKKTMEKIGQGATPPSLDEMRTYYKNNLSLFKKPERILIHHAFHKKKPVMEQAYSALKQGKSWNEAMKKLISEKPEITKAQWVERGVSFLFDRMFTFPHKFSPVWSDSHGWHLIQVLEKAPAHTVSFKQAKKNIQKVLLNKRQKALFTKWLDKQSRTLKVFKDEKAIKKIKVKLL